MRPLSYPILVAGDFPSPVPKAYDVGALPLTIVIDSDGFVTYVQTGFLQGVPLSLGYVPWWRKPPETNVSWLRRRSPMSRHGRGPALFRPNLMACGLLAVYLAVPQARLSSAQMDMSGHMMGTENQTPPDQLPVPQKMTGIGTVHLQITATPEAEMWFDQGLNLLHDFWDYEAARAFEQSIRVDPRCAMCYWGLYEAESFYHGTSQGYAGPGAGQGRQPQAPGQQARSPLHRGHAQQRSTPRDLQLWRELVRKYPRDTEARIFLAQHTGPEERLSILQSILKDDPRNSAANHLYIHALEASASRESAP